MEQSMANVHSPRPDALSSPPLIVRRRHEIRAALLATVAALAVACMNDGVFGQAPAVANANTSELSPVVSPVSFADVVDHVRGAVVSVKVKTTETADSSDEFEIPHVAPGDPLERFFKHFGDKRFGEEGAPHDHHLKPHLTQAQGSGFIISSDGYVVTNHHVVENATEVSVTLDDGKTVPATIVGTDKRTDLALLKIKQGGPYQHVDFATATPRVGDWVIAVGNPFGLGGTVTAGIISARGRDIGAGPYDDFLQIDAPVNRGNSGGPTFNTQGQVVGINTAIFSPSGGSVGIGFAIPAESAQNVIAALKDKGVVARGWIGVQIIGGHVCDHARNHIALAADRADDRCFAGTNASGSPAAAAFIPMPVLGQAADESFIDLNNTAELPNIFHQCYADTVTHIPSRFERTETHITPNLARTLIPFLLVSIKWMTRYQSRSGLFVFSNIVPVRWEKRYAPPCRQSGHSHFHFIVLRS
jgi:S1-C subfamily serine protease